MTFPDAFWFVYLWFLDLPAGWLAGVAVMLSGAAAGAALQLRRDLRTGKGYDSWEQNGR